MEGRKGLSYLFTKPPPPNWVAPDSNPPPPYMALMPAEADTTGTEHSLEHMQLLQRAKDCHTARQTSAQARRRNFALLLL